MTTKLIISLIDQFGETAKEQICRTCTHNTNHAAAVPLSKLLKLRDNGESLSEVGCQPDQYATTMAVQDRRLVTLSTADATKTQAKVHTCGQQLMPKCATCVHLDRITVNVAYTLYPGGPQRYTEILVGGTCKIPAKTSIEALEAHVIENPQDTEAATQLRKLTTRVPHNAAGKPMWCSYQRRSAINITPSCLNCKFSYSTSDARMIDPFLMQVGQTDLTPYQMEEARRNAAINEINVGRAINEARSFYLGRSNGTWRFYPVQIIEDRKVPQMVRQSDGSTKLMFVRTGYVVRISGTGDELFVDTNDDVIFVLPFADGVRGMLQVMDPFHRQLGFNDAVLRRSRVFPELPKLMVTIERTPDRVHTKCIECRPSRACYFHAKAPVYKPLIDEVVFTDPAAGDNAHEYHAERSLFIARTGTNVKVVDGNGDNPHPALFLQQLSSLLRNCKNKLETAQIIKQWSLVLDGLPYGKPHYVQIGYPNPTQDDPFKSYCSHPSGLDFRELFDDRFGSSNPEGWAARDDREAYLRAQVSERQFSPMQAYLEDMANIDLFEDQSANFEPLPEPQQWVVVHYDMWGAVMADPDAEHIATERKVYRDWLDETITIKRDEDDMEISNMRRLHGFDFVMGNRSSGDPAWLFDRPEQYEDDSRPNDKVAYYICVRNPEHKFSPDEIGEDNTDISCPTCEGELFWHEAHHEDLPARRTAKRRGLGNAVGMDRPYHLEQSRLLGLCCDNWQLKGSSPIRPFNLASLDRRKS